MNSDFIYVLIDPRTGEFRYIGMTTCGRYRCRDHARLAVNGENSHKANWIRQLQTLGLEYEIGVLERCVSSDKLPAAEIKWISCYRGMGTRLTNATDGGEGMLNPTPELRAKISNAKRGRPKSESHRAKLAEASRGNQHAKGSIRTPAHRKILSETMSNFKHSEESRQKISVSISGSGNGMFGRRHTPEAKAKMAAARKAYYARKRQAHSAT